MIETYIPMLLDTNEKYKDKIHNKLVEKNGKK